ncbi:MAG: hypothetical protein HON65_15300 [Rhodospirillales bacterium]|jgi:hypothetical protein|nr:hypothetical protein [Rhodospirillales bacterium]
MSSKFNPFDETHSDQNSLFAMPLGIMPIQTAALKNARLIKNARLETVVEFFSDSSTGSGQMQIRDLPAQFSWPPNHPDIQLLKKLGALPSYDVYSLRLATREMDISVQDIDALRLSADKTEELTSYMSSFTRPLILQIFGDDQTCDIEDFDDILNLFRSPDKQNALDRLKQMAAKLSIRPDQVPTFLEDYGDIFLALSYYRQCLDEIEPIITTFLESLDDLKKSYQFKEDRALQSSANEVESILNEGMAGLTGRFEAFDRSSSNMWQDISADKFRRVENLIRGYHVTNGGVLCALSLKMTVWANAFPTSDSGSPTRRAELLSSDIRQGIEKISDLEKKAPKLSEIN